MNLVHRPTFRLNSLLFLGFLFLSIVLWRRLPDDVPVAEYLALRSIIRRKLEEEGIVAPR